MTDATLLALSVGVPLMGAVLIALLGRWPDLRETTSLVTAGALLLVVLALLERMFAGAAPELKLIAIAPGLEIAFRVEPLGMLFGLVASGLWLVTTVYSIGYMRENIEPRQTGFYVWFAVALAATMGVAFAGNLLTLFLFYEALTLSTYPLVTHSRSEGAIRAGRIYLIMLIGASLVLLLPAIVITYGLAGTLDFKPDGILGGTVSPLGLAALLGLFVFGSAKAAIMPLHAWLPAAMVAPIPVSALLHAVAVVKAGVFAILKIVVYIFGLETLREAGAAHWLVWVAGATILLAALIALNQDDLKRRLAYSTVSQISYVVLGAAILAPISVMGAAFHIAAHAVSKITLFFAAGSVYTAAGLTKVSQLDGIGRKMPETMGVFAFASLSVIGLPPTAGFLSKSLLLSGATETADWAAVVVLMLSTVLTACYLLPIVVRAFFRAPADGIAGTRESAWPMTLAVCFTAFLTLILFVWPQPLEALLMPLADAEAGYSDLVVQIEIALAMAVGFVFLGCLFTIGRPNMPVVAQAARGAVTLYQSVASGARTIRAQWLHALRLPLLALRRSPEALGAIARGGTTGTMALWIMVALFGMLMAAALKS